MSPEQLIRETLGQGTTTVDQRAQSRHVERDEFCMLLTSRRKLVRANDRSAGIWGLVDPQTGERFLIDEKRLFTN